MSQGYPQAPTFVQQPGYAPQYSSQYPPQQYAPQQYPPQQYMPQQYPPQQNQMAFPYYPSQEPPIVATTVVTAPSAAPSPNRGVQPGMILGGLVLIMGMLCVVLGLALSWMGVGVPFMVVGGGIWLFGGIIHLLSIKSGKPLAIINTVFGGIYAVFCLIMTLVIIVYVVLIYASTPT